MLSAPDPVDLIGSGSLLFYQRFREIPENFNVLPEYPNDLPTYYLFDTVNPFLFNGTKMSSLEPDPTWSIINLPPGCVTQDYGSAFPSPDLDP